MYMWLHANKTRDLRQAMCALPKLTAYTFPTYARVFGSGDLRRSFICCMALENLEGSEPAHLDLKCTS